MAVVSVIAGAGATTAEVIKAAGSAESGSIIRSPRPSQTTRVPKAPSRPSPSSTTAPASASSPSCQRRFAIAQLDADKSVVVGRVELVEEEELHVLGELKRAYAAEQAQGRTAVLVGGVAKRAALSRSLTWSSRLPRSRARPAVAGHAPGAAHW